MSGSCLLPTCQDLPGTITQLRTNPPVRDTQRLFVMPLEPHLPWAELQATLVSYPGCWGQRRHSIPGQPWKPAWGKKGTRSQVPGCSQACTRLLRRTSGPGMTQQGHLDNLNLAELGQLPATSLIFLFSVSGLPGGP